MNVLLQTPGTDTELWRAALAALLTEFFFFLEGRVHCFTAFLC